MQEGIKKATVLATAFIVALILIAPAILTTGAFAQPPSNDDFDNATLIPSLPFSDSINTEEATRAADDPECGGNDDHTVWYRFTPDQDVSVQANTRGSDYPATLSVFTGSRGSLEQIACSAPNGTAAAIFFDATAGQTYFFMVGSFFGGPGGNLVFNVDIAPPPFDLEVSVNPTGNVNSKSGVVTISGTVLCSEDSDVFFSGDVTQRAGRVTIKGSFPGFVSCAGGEEPTPWSATLEGENGRFVAGRASVTVLADGCGAETGTCDIDQESRTVQLRGSR
jgi:hypothetical protein